MLMASSAFLTASFAIAFIWLIVASHIYVLFSINYK